MRREGLRGGGVNCGNRRLDYKGVGFLEVGIYLPRSFFSNMTTASLFSFSCTELVQRWAGYELACGDYGRVWRCIVYAASTRRLSSTLVDGFVIRLGKREFSVLFGGKMGLSLFFGETDGLVADPFLGRNIILSKWFLGGWSWLFFFWGLGACGSYNVGRLALSYVLTCRVGLCRSVLVLGIVKAMNIRFSYL